MPAYRARALVLRKTKLGETDVILEMLSSDGTLLRGVAKGMRKPGSRFAGRLEPAVVSDVLLHTGRSLDVVTEAETVESHAGVRQDFDRCAAASVALEFLAKVAVEAQHEERLFGLAVATLTAIEDCAVEALPLLVSAFLLKGMAIHGLRPELASCACCGGDAAGGTRFSLDAGGVVCPKCSGEAASLEMTEEARCLLATLLRSTMAEVAAMRAGETAATPPPGEREAFRAIRAFVRYHLPTRLKALDLFEQMGALGSG